MEHKIYDVKTLFELNNSLSLLDYRISDVKKLIGSKYPDLETIVEQMFELSSKLTSEVNIIIDSRIV